MDGRAIHLHGLLEVEWRRARGEWGHGCAGGGAVGDDAGQPGCHANGVVGVKIGQRPRRRASVQRVRHADGAEWRLLQM